jgi:hypothetical protein
MKSESILCDDAMKLLIEHFGIADTQRFIAHINSGCSDYTKWRRDKWDDKTVEELHNEAAASYYARHPQK